MESKKQINILVTGVGGPAGINISRLLKDFSQITVFGCDMDEMASGQVLTDTFRVAPAVRDTVAYKDWMERTVADHSIDIVIPTVHEELRVLRTFSDDLPAYVPLSGQEELLLGDEKLRMYAWAATHLPHNYIPYTTLATWTPSFSASETLFLKPNQGRGARGCRSVSQDELPEIQEHTTNPENWIVMELMPGKEWTVDAYIDADGDITYLTPRVRLGLVGGISIKGETIRDQAVIAATELMLSKLHCRGPICIQWKADADGIPRLIEMNPRLSGGLPISVAGGINPAKALLEEFAGKKPEKQEWKEVKVLGYYSYHTL